MKTSTLSARQHLANALESICKAQDALRMTGEQGPSWLLMEAMARSSKAKTSVEIAGVHVAELLESEIGISEPER